MQSAIYEAHNSTDISNSSKYNEMKLLSFIIILLGNLVDFYCTITHHLIGVCIEFAFVLDT